MPFQLIAVDLDGTLLGGTTEGYGFLPEGIDALRQAVLKQTKIAIVTGRSIGFVIELLNREQICYQTERWPHFIIADDCLIYHLRDGNYEPHSEWNEMIQRAERLHFDRIRAEIDLFIANNLSFIHSDIFRANHKIEQARGYVEIKFPDASVARRGERILTEWLASNKLPYAAIRVRKYVFIRHLTVSKGNSLNTLCRKHHIPISKVLAIGDSGNDLSMLDGRFGFVGASPGNAETEIKQAINNQGGYVAKNHYGRGVAEVISTLFPSSKSV